VAAQQHTVSLNWNASTSSVVGYNVYRGTIASGPYPTKVASTVPSTDYTDSSVSSGTTYYYVVTAVDSNNNESAYSNQATAVIP
jgi:fibronectin type 3 domain-containing protein